MVETWGMAGLITVVFGAGAVLYGVLKLLEIKFMSWCDR